MKNPKLPKIVNYCILNAQSEHFGMLTNNFWWHSSKFKNDRSPAYEAVTTQAVE